MEDQYYKPQVHLALCSVKDLAIQIDSLLSLLLIVIRDITPYEAKYSLLKAVSEAH